jgi:hypothetical protein
MLKGLLDRMATVLKIQFLELYSGCLLEGVQY